MHAHVFGEVLAHERRLFKAERTSWIVATLLLCCVGYALVNGNLWVRKQKGATQAALAEEARRLQEVKKKFQAKKPAASAYADPANAYWVGNRHAATYAVLPPSPLAVTAVGQSDLNPPYVLVSADNKDTFALNEEIENPGNLLVGNFDLAFVLVFLLPLVVIALSYNILSAEREQGTLALVMTNPVRLWIFLAGKAVFRWLFLGITLSLAVAILLPLAGTEPISWNGLLRFALWVVAVFIYTAFWLALAVFVNLAAASSARHALVLTGFWIAFLLVIPGFTNIWVSAAYPVPSRVEMVGKIREAQSNANKEADASVARFEQEHPEMTAPGKKREAHQGVLKRLMVQRAAAERIAEIMAAYDMQIARQSAAVNWLRFLSPAILMQEALSVIAGTDSQRYRDFAAQIDNFHREWQNFFVPRAMNNQQLTLADFETFPRFKHAEPPMATVALSVLGLVAGILFPTVLLLSLSFRKIKKFSLAG